MSKLEIVGKYWNGMGGLADVLTFGKSPVASKVVQVLLAVGTPAAVVGGGVIALESMSVPAEVDSIPATATPTTAERILWQVQETAPAAAPTTIPGIVPGSCTSLAPGELNVDPAAGRLQSAEQAAGRQLTDQLLTGPNTEHLRQIEKTSLSLQIGDGKIPVYDLICAPVTQ